MTVTHEQLVEHLLGCSEDPERIEAWLATAPEAAAALERARAEVALLESAARVAAPTLDLRPGAHGAGSRSPELAAPASPRRPVWGRAARRAAALLVLVLGIALPWGRSVLLETRLAGADGISLVLSGPSGVPAGAPAEIRVETWNAFGEAAPARLTWTARGAEGEPLAQGELDCDGTAILAIPQDLDTRTVEVLAVAASGEQRLVQTLALEADRSSPVAHLAVDRPLARPGEPVRMSARLLDRLTLEPAEGWCTLRVVDAKGAPVETWRRLLESGVADAELTLPADARGGLWALELRDRDDSLTVARQEFEVRRFQPSQLVKRLELAQQSYGPGESGLATLDVTRAIGGAAAGADVAFELLVDGTAAWSGLGTCDESGHVAIRFTVPEDVERGEARLLARVSDGGVVETTVRPFVVPTGSFDVALHPEGGALVANAPTRVYFEVTDALGRPVEAEGRVLGEDGREAARFTTRHDGRGWFEVEARSSEALVAEVEGARSAPVPLPAVEDGAVGLRAESRSPEAVVAELQLPDAGPWLVGLYCRGTLIAQDALQGSGLQRLELPVREGLGGVLRLTVFDRTLRPRAERLVHHESGRALRVAVEPRDARTLPGVEQEVLVRTTDEAGVPVAATVGVVVTDATLADLTDAPRLGLADTVNLIADLEAERLDDLDELLVGGEAGAERIDLVLGTRGWRRFGWVDPAALREEHGDAGRRLAIREGRSLAPRVANAMEGVDEAQRLARSARRAERAAGDLSGLALALLVLLAGWGLIERAGPLQGRPGASLAATVVAGFGLLVTSAQLLGGGVPDVAIRAGIEQAAGGFELADLEMPPAVDAAPPGEILFDEGPDRFGLMPRGGVPELMALGYADDFPVEVAAGAAIPLPQAAAAAPEVALEEPVEEAEELDEAELRGFLAGADDFFLGAGEERIAASRQPMRQWARVYSHRNPGAGRNLRSDFTETLYWNPLLTTSASGEARFSFETSDRATTWEVAVDAHGASRVGQTRGSFESAPPLSLEARLPVELTEGDRVDLVVALRSDDAGLEEALVVSRATGLVGLAIEGEDSSRAALRDGRGRVLVSVVAGSGEGEGLLEVAGRAGAWTDGVAQRIGVVPRGFPHEVHQSGVVRDQVEFRVAVPEEFVDGSLAAELELYPSPLTDLLQGLEGILQLPHGCFEQASATHYPNVLAMAYMRAAGIDAPEVAAQAEPLLASGLERLVGYECSERGFEWFGGSPAHEALSAYGLLEFHDTARVFDVDPDLLERTRAWLFSRRNGEGGYERNPRALDRFGAATEEVTDAFVTYALACCGTPAADLEGELDRLEGLGLQSEDPYVVALAAGALHAAGRLEPADAARDRLKAMQDEEGALTGTQGSITSSRGADLTVETTALAVAAWLDDPEDEAYARRGVEALLAARQGSGRFGSTQATIQALRTLVRYAEVNRRVAYDGTLEVFVDDRLVRTVPFEAGRIDPLALDDLASELPPGEHRVRLALTGGNEFPFAFALRYHADVPADAPDAPVDLTCRFADGAAEVELLEGESATLQVQVRNLATEGQGMVLATIGLPAGLEVPTRVLEDLVAAEAIDLWERTGREVHLYWRDLEPRAALSLELTCVARIPGTTTGPASRVRPYYAPDLVRWADPLGVRVIAAE